MSIIDRYSVGRYVNTLSDHLTKLICHHEAKFQMTFLLVWYLVCFFDWLAMTPLLSMMVLKMTTVMLIWAKVKQSEL